MADVITLRVRGEGGAEFDMDLPAEGSPRREIFDEFVAKGWLVILEGEVPAPAAPAVEADVVIDGEPAPEPAPEDPEPTRKPRASKRAADIVADEDQEG